MKGEMKPTREPQQPSRWPGVYWLMSQDFKRRYGPDACATPPPLPMNCEGCTLPSGKG